MCHIRQVPVGQWAAGALAWVQGRRPKSPQAPAGAHSASGPGSVAWLSPVSIRTTLVSIGTGRVVWFVENVCSLFFVSFFSHSISALTLVPQGRQVQINPLSADCRLPWHRGICILLGVVAPARAPTSPAPVVFPLLVEVDTYYSVEPLSPLLPCLQRRESGTPRSLY